MANDAKMALALSSELEAQHRKFFRYTGWLMLGGGILVAICGASFVKAGREVPRVR